MEAVTTIASLREVIRSRRRDGVQVGLVPTMGYLHEGHLSLIRQARLENDLVAASVFVNPLQFGPTEDFDRYPRDLERDSDLLRGAGADLLFAPTVAEMYPEPRRTFVEVTELTTGLCGASRPGHFQGVATVVSKLFHIVQPDSAYFGEKDYQQLQVIRRMVTDLHMDIRIVGVPIVREADGLALSSRNVYLQGPERAAARVLYRAITRARERVAAGERNARALVTELAGFIAGEPLARLDYVEIVEPGSLAPVAELRDQARLVLAVYIGRTRLIDNALLEVES